MGTVNNLPTVYDPAQVERKWYEYWKAWVALRPNLMKSRKCSPL
jgi:valyl-tRNA synthetase